MPSLLPAAPRRVHEFRTQRTDGRFHQGTTADFLAQVE